MAYALFLFLCLTPNQLFGFSRKYLGIDDALLPNREWNQKQKHKKQPWGNVECFAFGGGTVRFASLETSFHAANHTIPLPPSYEVGGIDKRIKTARLRRKTNLQKSEYPKTRTKRGSNALYVLECDDLYL